LRERALLARLEFTAFMRGANEILSINDKGARAWFFPHKWIGLPIGFTDAVCADTERPTLMQLASTWAPKIMLAPRDRIVRMMATNEANSPCTAEGDAWNSGDLAAIRFHTRLEDVLPLAPTYEATLTALGKRTRRNIRLSRKRAATAKITCSRLNRIDPRFEAELLELNAQTLPQALPRRRIDRYERFIGSWSGAFRSVLRDANGAMLSYAGGVVRGNVAYLIYQLNHREWASISPALLHRSCLIEQFTQDGVKEMIFVHGCVGTLRHSCQPIYADEIWLLRPRLSTRLLSAAMASVLPVGMTVATRHSLRQFALGSMKAR
jgi:hypothetical protein